MGAYGEFGIIEDTGKPIMITENNFAIDNYLIKPELFMKMDKIN